MIDGETLPLLSEEHLLDTLGLKLGPALKIRSQVKKKKRLVYVFLAQSHLNFNIKSFSMEGSCLIVSLLGCTGVQAAGQHNVHDELAAFHQHPAGHSGEAWGSLVRDRLTS